MILRNARFWFAGTCFLASLASLASAQEAPKSAPKSVPMTGMGGGSMAPAKPAAAVPPAEPVEVKASLSMSVRALDFENGRKTGMMLMPSSATLSTERPSGVTKEPAYVGSPKYATLTLGNAKDSLYTIALDEPKDETPRIYADLNGNGDLTDDATGSWDKATKAEGAFNCEGTFVFKVRWVGAKGEETTGEYGLNFFRSTSRSQLGFYRASMRVGEITIGGTKYPIRLIENDNDACFDKLYNPDAPTVVDDPGKRPMWIEIGQEHFDARVTFGFAGVNFLPTCSADGSEVTLTPTFKTLTLPKPKERPKMLGTGGEVPEFTAFFPDGGEFKPSDYRNKKVLVIDMWATWCGPCLQGLPHFNELASKAKGQDVEFVALNVFDESDAYAGFIESRRAFAVRWARDKAGRESDASIPKRLFNVTGIPATYVIDKSGKIVAAISGFSPDDHQLRDTLVGLGIKFE
jgi:thiol-disulfide isomerase/thioredoxin